MSQLRQSERLKQLNVKSMLVTFDADFMALAYIRDTKLTWPMLLDGEKKLYTAYQFERGSWWTLYGIPSITKYLSLIFRGWNPGKPGSDWSQLGGNVLIDPVGIVRFHHASKSPHDRPSVESLLDVIETIDER